MSAENKCPKCSNTQYSETIVDKRLMYECGSCFNIWYSKRIATDGYTHLKHDIADEVEKNGLCEIDTRILLNTSFRQLDGEPSTEEQIKKWAKLNKMIVSFSNEKVLFSR